MGAAKLTYLGHIPESPNLAVYYHRVGDTTMGTALRLNGESKDDLVQRQKSQAKEIGGTRQRCLQQKQIVFYKGAHRIACLVSGGSNR